MTLRSVVPAILLCLVLTPTVSAQSLQVGAHVAASQWSEFDGNDTGFGGRLTFKPSTLIGLDAELTWYPSDFTDEGPAFSRSRTEGLFGVTVGPQIGQLRPFAKATAGFLKVGQTTGGFACITIFPPPLACALAAGDTLPAFEVGGGLEIGATSRVFVRGDAGYRFLKYPGPTFGDNFEIHEEGFFGGALRFTLGAGLRF